jgi:hypothetical protein
MFGWGWWWLWNCSGWWPADRRGVSMGLPLCGIGACLIVWGLFHVLTAIDRRAENVRVLPVVISELKLRNVQRHIFGANFVEAADNPALEDRPKAFNRVGMDRADYVLLAVVIDRLVIVFGQAFIDPAFIGREQANPVGNHFAHESLGGFFVNVLQHAGDDVALARYGTNDRSFGGRAMLAQTALAIPMLVLVLSADERLVNLDNAAEFFDVLNESGPDLVTHEPRGFVGTEAHVAHDLEGTHSLFAGEHEMRDLEPIAQRLVGVFENRSGDMRKPIAVRGALLALPMPLARFEVIDLGIATARATHAIGPPTGNQIRFTGILVREGRVELRGGHLRHGLRTFCHGSTPLIEPYSRDYSVLSSAG